MCFVTVKKHLDSIKYYEFFSGLNLSSKLKLSALYIFFNLPQIGVTCGKPPFLFSCIERFLNCEMDPYNDYRKLGFISVSCRF